jgi:hypothetical protein
MSNTQKTQAEIAAENEFPYIDVKSDWKNDLFNGHVEDQREVFIKGYNAASSLKWKKVDKGNIPEGTVLIKYGNIISLGSFRRTEKFLVFTSISDVTLYYPLDESGDISYILESDLINLETE